MSRDCGLEEAVVENETALLVSPDNPLETASAILRLLTDDLLRAEMGRSARCHALGTATWAKRMQSYHEILQELVAGEA